MKRFLRSPLHTAFAVFLLALPALALPAFAQDLPQGESLFEKSVEKSGGAEAFAKIKSSVLTGTINMPAQNVSGNVKVYSQGELTYTVLELPGIGKIEDGYDGNVAWEMSAIQGARIKEGDEKTALKNASSISMMKSWKERFKELKTLGIEDVDGKPAYKVEVTPKEGKPMTLYFDQSSMLVVKLSAIVPSPMGEIPTDTILTDYKPVSGVMTPFTLTQKIMTASIVSHFDTIQYNVEIPKDRFDLPPTIKELVEKKKAQ